MIKHLEEIMNGDLLVLDANLIGSQNPSLNLTRMLYEGLHGLKSVSEYEIDDLTEGLDEIKGLIRRNQFVAIPEVIAEIEAFCDIIEEQINFILKQQPYKKHTRRKDNYHDECSFFARTEKTDALNRCRSNICSLLKIMKEQTLQEDESKLRDYELFGGIINSCIDQMAKSHLFSGKVPSKTDKKIIAVAFSYAYQTPVMVLTSDKGIRDTAIKIGDAVKSEEQRKRFNILLPPQNEIKMYSTRNQNKTNEENPRLVYSPN